MDAFWPERSLQGESILRFVLERVTNAHKRVLCICGSCGTGKSSTLAKLPSALEKVMKDDSTLRLIGGQEKLRTPRFFYENCSDKCSRDVYITAIQAMDGKLSSMQNTDVNSCQECLRDLFRRPRTSGFPILILDEADVAQPGAKSALKFLSSMAWETDGRALCLVFVSNSKALSFIPPNRSTCIVFPAYTAEQLRSIAQRGENTFLINDNTKSQSKKKRPRSPQPSVHISNAALNLAAGTAVNVYGGDARKVVECCRGAILTSIRSRDGETKQTGHVQVTAAEMRSSIEDLDRGTIQVMRQLPSTALFTLCCLLSLDYVATKVGGRTGNHHVRDIGMYLQKVVREINHASVASDVKLQLANLADQGLVTTSGELYALNVHPKDVQEALAAQGYQFDVARQIIFESS